MADYSITKNIPQNFQIDQKDLRSIMKNPPDQKRKPFLTTSFELLPHEDSVSNSRPSFMYEKWYSLILEVKLILLAF